MNFADRSQIQIGWLGGCIGNGTYQVCDDTNIGLYDESINQATGSYVVANDGSLSYLTTDIYRIEYYSASQCWDVFSGYNYLVRADCGTFPTSGDPSAGSEVNNRNSPTNAIEMPYTYYGSTNPNSNSGLRIKGANGYEIWGTSLSSGTTNAYDERYCPNPTNCLATPNYIYSDLVPSYYYFDGYAGAFH